MRSAALTLLAALDEQQRALAAQPFEDDAARRWLEYRPRRRPGASIARMSETPRKAAHRLLVPHQATFARLTIRRRRGSVVWRFRQAM